MEQEKTTEQLILEVNTKMLLALTDLLVKKKFIKQKELFDRVAIRDMDFEEILGVDKRKERPTYFG